MNAILKPIPAHIPSNTSDEELLAMLRDMLPTEMYEKLTARFDDFPPQVLDELQSLQKLAEDARERLSSEQDDPLTPADFDSLSLGELRIEFKELYERINGARTKLGEIASRIESIE